MNRWDRLARDCGTNAAPGSGLRAQGKSRVVAGQALVELGIFGSLLILLLGVLINYGLEADYRQFAAMEAFRGALREAAQPANPTNPACADPLSIDCVTRGGGSMTVVRDRHIPDPSDPFTIGSAIPIVASADVLRTPDVDATPDVVYALPRTQVVIQQQQSPQRDVFVDCPTPGVGCTTAGFRGELIPADSLDRYREIYGGANVEDLGLVGNRRQVLIVDDCEGEIISFEGCVMQAGQIVDRRICRRECNRGRRLSDPANDAPSCREICRQPMNIPWYAQRAVEQDGQWQFLNLEELFANPTKIRVLGLQPTTTSATTLSTTRRREEDATQVKTTSALEEWTHQTARTALSHDHLDQNGFSRGLGVRPQDQMSSTVSDKGTTTWTTPW